jgi:hypothetical protein
LPLSNLVPEGAKSITSSAALTILAHKPERHFGAQHSQTGFPHLENNTEESGAKHVLTGANPSKGAKQISDLFCQKYMGSHWHKRISSTSSTSSTHLANTCERVKTHRPNCISAQHKAMQTQGPKSEEQLKVPMSARRPGCSLQNLLALLALAWKSIERLIGESRDISFGNPLLIRH